MNIEINYHTSEIKESSNVQAYLFHNVDVYTTDLELFGNNYNACCQAGSSFYHNDYSTPHESLELADNSTDTLVWALYHLDSEPSNEELSEFASEYDLDLNTVIKDYDANYTAVCDFISICGSEFSAYKEDNNISDEPDDYIEDESTGLAIFSPSLVIQKSELISAIIEHCCYFGDSFKGLYVDETGCIDCLSKSDSNGLMPILTFSGMGDYVDDNQYNPNDENYDAKSVAEYIVEDGECLNFSGVITDDNGSEVKYKFQLI